MRSVTRKAAQTCSLVASMILAAAALVACSDQPVGGRTSPEAGDGLQAFDCRAVLTGTPRVSCTSATPGTGGASGVIYGGQNVYVTLTSTNLSYDAGTEIFQFDATVQNLMNEAIGTPDGVTPAPNGIRVFFADEPSNGVTVSEPSGTAFFTSPNQAYHEYSEILDKDEVSSSKTWKFQVPSGVTSFSFGVLIDTEVEYKLVINEVMANPVGATTSEQPLEWVELYNAGTRPVDLQNLVIADSAASGRRPYHLINTSVVVPAGGYVVLGGSSNTTLNGGAPVDYSYGTALNQLANSLDAVKIARVVGNDTLTLDRTQYSNPSVSAQEGVSRELKNPALDNSNMDGSNWDNASVTSVYGDGGRGTPKAQNSAYTP
ncbi:MAG TPA: lamin tail domain-containing protein [Longimicrobium sp.]|nr:lamin tail domain-containing protein [Longimicrobium sp.]